MDQNEPVGIHGSKGHVRPYIAVLDNHGGAVEGRENHENRIGHGTVEGIEEAGIRESVVGFM
eukprot:CAMPEP_0197259686 /NCGR_PEP_ID=MMETSP1429-20130617/83644_1 /TAXON_ID=49237 /ORGANISM="Chaetoceros  sp., Strain UNC1202" /LENGTH=61 /DNA_ID=CAMNT_0042723897 /DNA_START=468 /DNA_END=653 /DNA_ORIENTATION=+